MWKQRLWHKIDTIRVSSLAAEKMIGGRCCELASISNNKCSQSTCVLFGCTCKSIMLIALQLISSTFCYATLSLDRFKMMLSIASTNWLLLVNDDSWMFRLIGNVYAMSRICVWILTSRWFCRIRMNVSDSSWLYWFRCSPRVANLELVSSWTSLHEVSVRLSFEQSLCLLNWWTVVIGIFVISVYDDALPSLSDWFWGQFLAFLLDEIQYSRVGLLHGRVMVCAL